VISMTGYAFGEKTEADMTVSVEIKGYNSRFLEVSVNAPPWLSALEPEIRAAVAGCCGRGRVDVSVRVKETGAPLTVTVNPAAAAAYMKAVTELTAALGLADKLSISKLLSLDGVMEAERERDATRFRQVLEPLLGDALAAFSAERAREGRHTAADILASLGRLEAALGLVKKNVPALEAALRENIVARFRELSAGRIDESRVLGETAVLLVKHTVAEEVSRLGAHLGEFRREAAAGERPGKKLDFLCQEMAREINTIGSKSAMLEVSRAVVEMKEALENVREQLRNIE